MGRVQSKGIGVQGLNPEGSPTPKIEGHTEEHECTEEAEAGGKGEECGTKQGVTGP